MEKRYQQNGLHSFFKRIKKGLYTKIRGNKIDALKMEFPTFPPEFNVSAISSMDYFRYATLGLAIQRLIDDNIEGSFAEVGVYKGDMSRFIHNLAKERVYYLFDTFEGFPKSDLEKDINEDNRFKDTTISDVIENIGNIDNIVIKKGYVPDTLIGLENEKFAFVLLDLDLYAPTVSSLNFFYPRIVKGGYLVVHDYNNSESNWACKRAVNEFMQDKSENIIEISDVWGSVLIRKSNY